MANPQRDEVALKVGDREYTLVLDFDALCQLEAVLSTDDKLVTAGEALLGAFKQSMTHNRALLFAASRRKHPALSLVQCGDLITEMGGVEAFLTTLFKLKQSLEPDQEDRPQARPQEARQTDGTGVPTTSKPDVSA